jgi:hypothetical protein
VSVLGVGSDVVWPGGSGTVDLIVTGGDVPGVDGPAVGTKAAPVARVRTEAGRVAVLLGELAEAVPAVEVSEYAVKTVRARGAEAWPGPQVTRLSRDEWAARRVAAFLATADGDRPAGYYRDDDLLPP